MLRAEALFSKLELGTTSAAALFGDLELGMFSAEAPIYEL